MTLPRRVEEVLGVTTLELFFDLVFVFCITQLTGVLAHDLTPHGLAEVALMFGVLWWMYSGYAWLTNTMAPTSAGRRLVVLAGMAGFLLVALATPTAFGDGGVLWGAGYLVLVAAHAALYAQGNPQIFRILPANLLAGVLIVGAGLAGHGPLVYVLWTLALVVPIVQPYVVPAGGRFLIQPGHIVERHGLLVMITIGESVIAVGVGAEGLPRDAGLAAAAVLGLALAAGVWWTYFDGDDARAEHALAEADETARTQMTMFGYFYAHLPLIIGIVAMAAGAKKAIGHAWGHLTFAQALALGGGVALYLLGDVWFRRVMGIGPSRIRLAGAAAALAVAAAGLALAAAELALLIAVLAAVVVAERRAPAPDQPKLRPSAR
ncbi:low temperature requirement protein A [Actinomadura parmotrematis]|uniref:Low temperature requirement protein A n=1 Tax=Actinomadura parmotrematis TaxID=2864039 RepID=A0ABS7FNN3_9ACTN|nr:low temperature requirement protein A [Actinomadura parmotrematis]MBW8481971.1 low temperature requirement protein A [Actinomadura parmotrematis]